MRTVLRSELRKLTTTVWGWLLALLLLLYMSFLGAVMAYALLTQEAEFADAAAGPELLDSYVIAVTVYTLPISLAYLFPLLLGALLIAGEFRHGTIALTLAAEPSRTRVLTAKVIVGGAMGLVYGMVGVLGSAIGGVPFLLVADEPTYLSDPSVWRFAALVVLAMGFWGVVGVGFGALVRNQVAVIVIILGFTQFAEPIVRMGLSAVEQLAFVGKLLPSAGAEALIGTSLYNMGGMADIFASRWAGAAVLVAYMVVVLLAGRWRLSQDVK